MTDGFDLIVGVRRVGNRFSVTDHTGTVREVSTPEELGRVVMEMLSDPNRPQVASGPVSGSAKIRNGAIEIVSGVLPPQLSPAAGPLVDAMKTVFEAIRRRPARAKSRAPGPPGARRAPPGPR